MAETLGDVIKSALSTQLKRQAPPPAGVQNIPVDASGQPIEMPFAGGTLTPEMGVYGGAINRRTPLPVDWNAMMNYRREF